MVFPSLKTLIGTQNVQLIGLESLELISNRKVDGEKVDRQALRKKMRVIEKQMKKTFIWAGFVSPGKHSIFLYDYLEDKFYVKIIVVNAESTKTVDVSSRQNIQSNQILD